MAQETQTGALYQPRGVECMDDGREVLKGSDICILMANSGEENGNPLQCSCLENPRDRGA